MTTKADLKDFQIVTSGFQCKGVLHLFADIAHLRFVRTKTNIHMGLPIEMTKIGSDESVGLMISLKSGEEIKLTEKPGWIFSSTVENIQGIINIYTELAKVTFNSRLTSYVKGAEIRGYFVYSGHRFFLSRQVIASEDQEFTSENTDFLRSYGYIEFRPKNSSIAQKMKRNIGASKRKAMDTLTDTDVIYAILANFYGLRWN
ncbi:MAG: hypothetical protein HZB62_13425 [Nitrospirae bacterium]|nr:hypothetical protein [Nitrospirota bacterium]